MRRMMRSEGAFTLIELLVVISIIGILAALTTIGVTKFRSDSQLKACTADSKTIEVAAQGFLAKTGSNPAAQEDDSGTLVTQGYLRSWPTKASGAYHLRWSGTDVDLVSGPDGC